MKNIFVLEIFLGVGFFQVKVISLGVPVPVMDELL
jgi:hypothetical protein